MKRGTGTYLYCVGLLAVERDEISKKLDKLVNKVRRISERENASDTENRIHTEIKELLSRHTELTHQIEMLRISS